MTQNKWISVVIFLFALAAFTSYWWSGAHGPPKSELIQEASAKTILDEARALNSPVVLVNFWASWCEPCKQEFPNFLRVKRELEPQGLRVIFVSVDDPADLAAAESFLKQQQVTFPTFYKGSQSLNFVAQIFPQWSGAVPATVLLGPDLKILDAWEGDTSLEELQERVKKHLKGT